MAAGQPHNTNQLLKIPLIKTQRCFVLNRKDFGTRAKLPLLPEAGPGFFPYAFKPQKQSYKVGTMIIPVLQMEKLKHRD